MKLYNEPQKRITSKGVGEDMQNEHLETIEYPFVSRISIFLVSKINCWLTNLVGAWQGMAIPSLRNKC